MKKIAWIDTMRVAAALMIIFAHYFMCAGFEESMPYFHYALSHDVAILGVTLFLAISGYLIPASLKRAPSLWQFYKRKLIRIVVPFTVSWFVMLMIMILLALFNDEFVEHLPITSFLRGGDVLPMLLGMFPVDLNVTKLFGIEVCWFVGEWFMGTILWLYLISPLLNYFAERRPIISLAVSIVVSIAVFYFTQGILRDPWTFFVVLIPEFLLGMILYIHREEILKIRLPLTIGTIIFLTMYFIYFVAKLKPEAGVFFTTNPVVFRLSLPVIYLMFVLSDVLNNLLPKIFAHFNSLNATSYLAMLIQHVVIYTFAAIVGYENLGAFGTFFVLLLIIATTFKASQLIKKISDRAEKFIS